MQYLYNPISRWTDTQQAGGSHDNQHNIILDTAQLQTEQQITNKIYKHYICVCIYIYIYSIQYYIINYINI
jgi:hypothetical protein